MRTKTFARRGGMVLAWYLLAASALAADGGHDYGETVDANSDRPPTVSIEAVADSVSGYNLRIDTTNFRFSPADAGGAHVDGAGHAHLYVDGAMVARLYGNWFHLPDPGPGAHDVRVTLNANDHRDYALDGVPIAAVTRIGDGGLVADVMANYAIVDGRLAGGADDVLRVTEGERVALTWRADAMTEIHLHGYDVVVEVMPDRPAVLAFDAEATGRFPVTVHVHGGAHGDAPLLYVEVYPR